MKALFRRIISFSAALVACALSSGVASDAQPADRSSKRIATYGNWTVVQKQGTYALPDTGQTGKYAVCSAVFFAKTGSLEFEVKNDVAWGVYVALDGWDYQPSRGALTIRSGSDSIRLAAAVYAGGMISAASHDLMASQRVDLKELLSLIDQNQPISFYDRNGSGLVTFPNDGGALSDAMKRAQRC